MNPLKNCGPEGYKEQFFKDWNHGKKLAPEDDRWLHSDGTVGSSDVVPVVYALLNTLKTMQERCKTSGPQDCTPAGYYNFVVKEVNPREKIVDLVVKEFIGNSLASLAGCVGIGIPAGVVGALKTPFAPYIGGTLGATQGCKMGLVVGPLLFNGYKVQLSMAEDFTSGIDNAKNLKSGLVNPAPKGVAKATGAKLKINGITGLVEEIRQAIFRYGSKCSIQEEPPFRKDEKPFFTEGGITLGPMTTFYRASEKVAQALCNAHPALARFCEALEIQLLNGLKTERGRALVLSSNSDHNGAFSLANQPEQVLVFKELERFYDISYKKVSNPMTFCQAIDETTKNGKIDLLIVRAHGTQTGIRLDENASLTIDDRLPETSCLQNLSDTATIVLDNCDTGAGKEYEQNFANFIASNSPEHVRIFASTIPHNLFTFLNGNEPEFQFHDTYRGESNSTYKIDESNKELAIKAHGVSNLSRIGVDLGYYRGMKSTSPATSLTAFRDNVRVEWLKGQVASPKAIDPALIQFVEEITNYAGSITGITPVYEEVKRIKRILETLVENPQQAPIKIAAELLKIPEQKLNTLLSAPEKLLHGVETLIEGSQALSSTVLGVLSTVGAAMAIMDSVSWVIEFGRDPHKTVIGVLTAPVDCVKGVYNLSRMLVKDPLQAGKVMGKMLLKAPEQTVNRFLTNIGLKKRKKAPPQQSGPTLEQQKQLAAKYASDLMALYMRGREQWYVDPFKTAQEYHHELFEDWQSAKATGMYIADYLTFPAFLEERLRNNDFSTIVKLSPRAHFKEAMLPPELAHEFHKLMFEGIILQHAFQAFSRLIEAESKASSKEIENMKTLCESYDSLHQTTQELHAIVGNLDALKAKLTKKKLEKN